MKRKVCKAEKHILGSEGWVGVAYLQTDYKNKCCVGLQHDSKR